MAKRIYVADDEKNICFLIQNFLEKEGFEVECFEDGESLLAACQKSMPDLCILDIMMPGMDGLTVCTRLRKMSSVPIIIVSAKDSPLDRITGITLGSDDYMVKPFLPKELSLRIGIILRRYYKGEDPIVQLTGSQIDFDRAEVIKENEHFPLTAKEHDILLALYRNAGRIVTIDQLCEAAWGDNPYGYENSQMAHIRRIREKIEKNPSKPVSLITVKGLGYS